MTNQDIQRRPGRRAIVDRTARTAVLGVMVVDDQVLGADPTSALEPLRHAEAERNCVMRNSAPVFASSSW